MGNRTDPKKWDARERLLYVELLAYWRGWIRRADLVKRFDISVPQASADIAAYLKLNPRSLRYDLNAKRYVASAHMNTKLNPPKLQAGLSLLGNNLNCEHVARVDLPTRHVPERIVRRLVGAAIACNAVEIHYYSINSGTEAWRWITPRTFAHDGYRWHVRAWCHDDQTFKDFVLGRMDGIRDERPTESMPRDVEWETWTTIAFRPHRRLDKTQRLAIEKDFGMRDGVGRIKARRAMLLYTLAYLGLSESGFPAAGLLEKASS